MAEHLEASRLTHEWRTFELYEKIRVRDRRRRMVIIVLTSIFFLSLCAVPVVEDRLPKWKSLRAAQRLSFEIEKMKTLSIYEKKPVKMTFLEGENYRLEILDHCVGGQPIQSEGKKWRNDDGALKILSADEAKALGVNLAVNELCFDPVYGLDQVKTKKVIIIAPVKDLSPPEAGSDQVLHALDRASYIILESESAKISIN